jgi:ATP phosphoribosyltransferase
LLKRAGFHVVVSSRSYRPTVDDAELELRLLRAQEIGRYVDHGFLDCGITGRDWVVENGADVEVIADLRYSRATSKPTRWVLVVPEDSDDPQSVKDLEGKRIATEAVGMTEAYLEKHGVKAEVEFSWGATEVKVPELVDAIVDITETGSSLRANKLRIVDTLMESYPQLVASHGAAADPWKREKMETLVLLLRAALEARDKVGLKMNVPASGLEKVIE